MPKNQSIPNQRILNGQATFELTQLKSRNEKKKKSTCTEGLPFVWNVSKLQGFENLWWQTEMTFYVFILSSRRLHSWKLIFGESTNKIWCAYKFTVLSILVHAGLPWACQLLLVEPRHGKIKPKKSRDNISLKHLNNKNSNRKQIQRLSPGITWNKSTAV